MNNWRPDQVNLMLCLILVFVGLWSYEASGRDFHTLSVPALGILLSLFHKPLKEGNEKMIKGAMLATLVIFVIMILPLRNSFNSGKTMAIIRVSIVLISSGLALLWYRSYIKRMRI